MRLPKTGVFNFERKLIDRLYLLEEFLLSSPKRQIIPFFLVDEGPSSNNDFITFVYSELDWLNWLAPPGINYSYILELLKSNSLAKNTRPNMKNLGLDTDQVVSSKYHQTSSMSMASSSIEKVPESIETDQANSSQYSYLLDHRLYTRWKRDNSYGPSVEAKLSSHSPIDVGQSFRTNFSNRMPYLDNNVFWPNHSYDKPPFSDDSVTPKSDDVIDSLSASKRSENLDPTIKEEEKHSGKGNNLKESFKSYLDNNVFWPNHSYERPGKVSLITGSRADQITNQYNADAITIGSNIFFAQEKLNTSTPEGLSLLVHELTHVKQQNEISEGRGQYRDFSVDSTKRKELESEASGNEKILYNYLLREHNAMRYGDCSISSAELGSIQDDPIHNNFQNISVTSSLSLKYLSGISPLYGLDAVELRKFREIPSGMTDLSPNYDSSEHEFHYPSLSYPVSEPGSLGNTGSSNSSNETQVFAAERTRSVDRDLAVNSSESSGARNLTQQQQLHNTMASNGIQLEILADSVLHIMENKIKGQKARRGVR